MGIPTGFVTVAFTTNSIDYELFDDSGIRNAIKEKLSKTEAELTTILAEGIRGLYYQILINGTNVSINGETYQPPFDDTIVSSDGYVRRPITSIRIEGTGFSGQFRFNIF